MIYIQIVFAFVCFFAASQNSFASTATGVLDGIAYRTTCTFRCGHYPSIHECSSTLNIVDINTLKTWTNSIVCTRTSNTPQKFTLAGEWKCDNYYCDTSWPTYRYTEQISIEVSDNAYTATKITGDPCVPAGEISFFGTIDFQPTDLTLARMSDNTYQINTPKWLSADLQDFQIHFISPELSTDDSFSYEIYKKGSEIVVAFRGTAPSITWEFIEHLLADKSFIGSSSVTDEMKSHINSAAKVMRAIHSDSRFNNCNITLTGHSLGGALAQIIGYKTKLPVATFNAPMAAKLANDPEVQMILKSLDNVSWNNSGNMRLIRTYGDAISSIGDGFSGSEIETIDPALTLMNMAQFPTSMLDLHKCSILINSIETNNARHAGLVNPIWASTVRATDILLSGDNIINSYRQTLKDYGIRTLTFLIKYTVEEETNCILKEDNNATGLRCASSNNKREYLISFDSNSPTVESILLPSSSDTNKYVVKTYKGNSLAGEFTAYPLQWLNVPSGTDRIRFISLDVNNSNSSLDNYSAFSVKFNNTGNVSAILNIKNIVFSMPPTQLLLLN